MIAQILQIVEARASLELVLPLLTGGIQPKTGSRCICQGTVPCTDPLLALFGAIWVILDGPLRVPRFGQR